MLTIFVVIVIQIVIKIKTGKKSWPDNWLLDDQMLVKLSGKKSIVHIAAINKWITKYKLIT